MKKKIILDLQTTYNSIHNCTRTIPNKYAFIKWTKCVFSSLSFFRKKKIELTIRIVDEQESQSLNMYFLKKNFPTNVLSFPYYPPHWINSPLIGDIIICQNIIDNEAKINKIPIEMYTAYIVIHGILHLLGYDHITKSSSENMKELENKIMKKLGYNMKVL